tara:strand:- start:714 stop:1289 length:576 start_codon:yes stop_codon:yes gene_type:complete
MAIILAFQNQINVSLQKKDNIYYNNTALVGGYQTSSDPQLVGGVVDINRHYNVLNKELSYIADGVTTEFDVIFQTYDGQYQPSSAEEIQVYVNNVETTNFTFLGTVTINDPLVSGDVVSINLLYSINVDDSSFTNPITNSLTNSSFISFLKNNQVNKKSVKGYYAEVKFVNNSKEKAELFSVGSEILESSK